MLILLFLITFIKITEENEMLATDTNKNAGMMTRLWGTIAVIAKNRPLKDVWLNMKPTVKPKITPLVKSITITTGIPITVSPANHAISINCPLLKKDCFSMFNRSTDGVSSKTSK